MKLLIALLLFLLPSVCFSVDYSIRLDQVRVADLVRLVYGDILHRSFLLDSDLINSSDVVTLNWDKIDKGNLESLVLAMLLKRGFSNHIQGDVLVIQKRDSSQDDLLIYEPRYRSAKYLSDILSKVADVVPLGFRGFSANNDFASAIEKQNNSKGSVSTVIDRSAPDQIAYECAPSKCVRLKKLLLDLDTPEAQVVLRAAVFEVGITRGEGSAVQLAAGLLGGKLSAKIGSTLSGADHLRFIVGGLDFVLSILDQDSRFKVVSRPMLRVRTGQQAKFSVGQQVPVLGSVSQDKNGNPLQSVEYRQSGTIFTVQPDIRRDVVDLDITQELSSFVNTTTGVNNSPTLLQRMASSKISIKPGEVIVFAGLEENRADQAESSFFGFKTGEKSSNTSSEVLLFIEASSI